MNEATMSHWLTIHGAIVLEEAEENDAKTNTEKDISFTDKSN